MKQTQDTLNTIQLEDAIAFPINEIFSSIAGECNGLHQGVLTTFVRIAGCNLRCDYCDTPNTQSSVNGKKMSIREILNEVSNIGNQVVCVTGGEPLIHENIISLFHALHESGYQVVLETNGTVDIPVWGWVDSVVMDYKFQYEQYMDLDRLAGLRQCDVIKFVFKNPAELMNGIEIQRLLVEDYKAECLFAFSPVIISLDKHHIAEYLEILQKNNELSCIFSLQLHKLIGVR